jgi:hypothetical protein
MTDHSLSGFDTGTIVRRAPLFQPLGPLPSVARSLAAAEWAIAQPQLAPQPRFAPPPGAGHAAAGAARSLAMAL